MQQRDKHYPDEIRLLLKKYNDDPQSMTTKESKVLQDFALKEKIPLNDLLGQLPVTRPVTRPVLNELSEPVASLVPPPKYIFQGKLYDFVLQWGDIEFGYNITDNPYAKAGELIRQYELSKSLDDTVLRTQIANIIQETVRKKAGEGHLEKLFPDEERVRATEEEKKEYESVVRNANIMIQKKVMEEEARRKKAKANVTNLIKQNQMRLRREKTGEVQMKMVDGVLTRTRVPKGIPDEQLSAILLDAERKERLNARQQSLKLQQPKADNQLSAMKRERSKKRRGMVSLKDFEEEKSTFQQLPREGYFRVMDSEGIKDVPIPKVWNANVVTAFSSNLFSCNVPLLLNFLRENVKMDEAALTYIDQNIAKWHLKLLTMMAQVNQQAANQEAPLSVVPELPDSHNPDKPDNQAVTVDDTPVADDAFKSVALPPAWGGTKEFCKPHDQWRRPNLQPSNIDNKEALVENENGSDLFQAQTGVSALGVKDDDGLLPVSDNELTIDDHGPVGQEQKLDIDGVKPEIEVDKIVDGDSLKPDDHKIDDDSDVRPGALDRESEEIITAARLDIRSKEFIEKIMVMNFETDWTWVRPATVTSTPKKKTRKNWTDKID